MKLKNNSYRFLGAVVRGYRSDCVGSVKGNQGAVAGGDRLPGAIAQKTQHQAASFPSKNRAAKNRKTFTSNWIDLLGAKTQSI